MSDHLNDLDGPIAVVTRTSRLTGQESTMRLPVSPRRIFDWYDTPLPERPYVQDAFPDLDAGQREFLVTGITPDEWERVIGDEPDE